MISMRQFDYARAWREVAKPAYETLPPAIHQLIADCATVAAELRQAPDLTMAYPEGDASAAAWRARFDAIDAETLAYAAHVVYFAGHWYPSKGTLTLPGRQHGNHWKFSKYADQSIRARFTDSQRTGHGIGWEIHDGMIRLTYSSRAMWTWEEVAPADVKGLEVTQGLASELSRAIAAAQNGLSNRTRGRTKQEAADSAAYSFMEVLRTRGADERDYCPARWAPWLHIAERYMVEEAEQIDRSEVIGASSPSSTRSRGTRPSR